MLEFSDYIHPVGTPQTESVELEPIEIQKK